MLNIHDYQKRVLAFIKKGNLTDEQWREITQAILAASESEDDYGYGTLDIDTVILSTEEFAEIYGDDD